MLVQVSKLDELFDLNASLTAGYAKALVLFYVLAVASTAAWVTLAPERVRGLPLAVALALAALSLGATLVTGALWPFVVAVLTFAACWVTGAWLLLRVRLPALAESPPVAWLAGLGVLGLAVLAVGHLGLLRWWTLGVPILVLGAFGLARAVAARKRPLGELYRAQFDSRLGAMAATAVVLLLAIAAVFAAAPELMYDALYGKAWMPAEWARIGTIGASELHPALNLEGLAQLIAVPGHLVGAPAIGRYLQWVAFAAVVGSVWWTLRRSPWAPLVAGVVAVTPGLFWQATTAYDDLLLCLGALGLASAVIITLEAGARDRSSVLRHAAALGALAGVCADLKLHLAYLAAGLLIGWLVAIGPRRLQAAPAMVAGGLAVVAPPLILRWIETGNPVFPSLNNVFKSDLWRHVDEHFNFPFMPDPGPWGPLNVIARSATDPQPMAQAAPPGFVGLLMGAFVVSLVAGWLARRRHPAIPALLVGLLFAGVLWYLNLRNLRYFQPIGVISVLTLGLALTSARPIGRRAEAGGVVAFALVAVLLWPSTVAQYWNVPGRDLPWRAALGLDDARDYETASAPERDAIAAFDAVAPPDALAISDLHQRAWLGEGRSLTPPWEVLGREPTLARFKDADPRTRLAGMGVGWALVTPTSTTMQWKDVVTSIQQNGQLEWADHDYYLWRFTDRPRPPAWAPPCDDRLAGRRAAGPGSWTGRRAIPRRRARPGSRARLPRARGRRPRSRSRPERRRNRWWPRSSSTTPVRCVAARSCRSRRTVATSPPRPPLRVRRR